MNFKTLSICTAALVLILSGIVGIGSKAGSTTFLSQGDVKTKNGDVLFAVEDLVTLDNKIDAVEAELTSLESSVGNNKTEILNALSINPNLSVSPDASFADITTYIQNMSTVPADTYFYEDGTEGDAGTIVRYKKIDGQYYVCDANGRVSEGAGATDVSSKTLVPYSATAAGNLSAGAAGYASNSFILGDGSDNAAYYEDGISFADSRINENSASYTSGYCAGINDATIQCKTLSSSFGTFTDALNYDYIVVSSFYYISGISSSNWNNGYGKVSISGATIIQTIIDKNYYWGNGQYEVRSYSAVIKPTSDTVTISGEGDCTVVGFYK